MVPWVPIHVKSTYGWRECEFVPVSHGRTDCVGMQVNAFLLHSEINISRPRIVAAVISRTAQYLKLVISAASIRRYAWLLFWVAAYSITTTLMEEAYFNRKAIRAFIAREVRNCYQENIFSVHLDPFWVSTSHYTSQTETLLVAWPLEMHPHFINRKYPYICASMQKWKGEIHGMGRGRESLERGMREKNKLYQAILCARTPDPVFTRVWTIVAHFFSMVLSIHQESIFVLHISVSWGWSFAKICSLYLFTLRCSPRWYQFTTSHSSYDNCCKCCGPVE